MDKKQNQGTGSADDVTKAADCGIPDSSTNIQEMNYPPKVEPTVQMPAASRKRQHTGEDNHNNVQVANISSTSNFKLETPINNANLTYDESELCQFQSLDEKRAKIQAEFAKLGVPVMTLFGPTAGSLQPNRGVIRTYEYDIWHVPTMLIDKNETLGQNGQIVHSIQTFQILTEYRNWYRYALGLILPNTRVEPRIIEILYCAWSRVVTWHRQGAFYEPKDV